MSTASERSDYPLPVEWDDDSGNEDLVHIVCNQCSPDISYCGLDLSARPEPSDNFEDDEITCVVCHDLIGSPCPKCGRTDA